MVMSFNADQTASDDNTALNDIQTERIWRSGRKVPGALREKPDTDRLGVQES
jgi:hypothetical protein